MNPGGVLVIGIDGGTWDVLGPLARRGIMPTLARVLDEGAHGELTSVVPWYTVPGWTSIMTGANPGRHGLLHWIRSAPSDYWENRRAGRPFTASTDLTLPTFWDVAGAAGKNVAVVNMPMTYPAWPVNGVLVTGLLTPAGDLPGRSHPEGFLDGYPGYRVDLRHAKGRESEGSLPPLEGLLGEMAAVTESRRRLMTDLVSGDRDLAVCVFVGMDRLSHRVWPQQRRILEEPEERWGEIEELAAQHYRTLDSVIGSLVDAAGPDATTLFVSDHGFGDGPDRKFRVNAWLRQAGYLRLRGGRAQQAAYRSPLRKVARKALKAWRRRAARRPAEHVGVSWPHTQAYAVHFSWCPVFGIVVNERGAKREGSVDPADVPALLDRLARDLQSIRDPATEGPVVRRVLRREEVADGPELHRLPHLFVEVDPRYFPDDGLRRAEMFDELQTSSGRHTREGLLGALGARVNAGAATAGIPDVAPTVLALLGVEPPATMDGKVLTSLVQTSQELRAAPQAEAPSGTAVELSEDEQAAIERHLRDLGYEE